MTEQATAKADPQGRPSSSIGRVFAVIRVLRRSPVALTLTTVAQEAGIAPSTAHSLLTELLAQGAVTLDENKRYRLGPSLLYLGSAYARATPLFRSTWIELVDLANELGVTAAIAIPWEAHHLIIASHQGGRSAVDVAFGGKVPLDGGSWGKAYFASAGVPLPEELGIYTSRTMTNRDDYETAIAATHSMGYAADVEEFAEGVAAVAAAVTSDSGYEGLASLMWAVGQTAELDVAKIGRRLAALTARASLSLGDPSRVSSVGSE
jgi:DNA-binding IclR family transcriptional regulator